MPESSSKEPDLGLSLDLGLAVSFPRRPDDLQMNPRAMPCLVSLVSSSDVERSYETQAFHRGIDVNRPPLEPTECEDEAGVSSPNSTVSSVSGKRGDRESNGEDPENQPGYLRGMSDEEDGENCRKKLRLSKEQSATLEETFREHNTLNPKQKLALAKQLGLRPRQVEVWFQNRRARTKLKQTEVDCEFLKRCCENLTEENRRLQKEVRELRALRLLPPQFYMHLSPPTTFTACPSCDHRSGTPHGPVVCPMSPAMPAARDL